MKTRFLPLALILSLFLATAIAQTAAPEAPPPASAAPQTPPAAPEAPAATAPAPPPDPARAEPRPERDTLQGVAIEDPYRYLENADDAATRAFAQALSTRTRETLDRIPGRAQLLDRIRALEGAATRVSQLQWGGTRLFYLRQGPGQSSAVIAMREGVNGAERVVLDPARAPKAEPGAAIESFAPSPDGQHVAYVIAANGAFTGTLRVAADNGRDAGIEIDRVPAVSTLAWQPDSRSLYYPRAAAAAGRAARANMRVYRHALGRDASHDEIVFAPGVGGAREVAELGRPGLEIPTESRYAYAIVREGARREIALHVTELRDLAAGKPRWRRIAGPGDGVTQVVGWKDDLFLLSHASASNYRVLRMKAAAALPAAKVVVAERDLVIAEIALASDALYLRTALAGVDRLERVPLGLLGAKSIEYVRTPFDNAITDIVTAPRRAGALLLLQGYIDAPAVLEIDARGNSRDTKIAPASPLDFAGMDMVRLYAPGPDGVKIPVTLVYRKGTQLTGENPTLLVVEGSHGRSVVPEFLPERLAWLERGGIFAVAHVRGGGEYGETWHAGGRGAAKANSARDLVAAAQFLQSYGFTSPKRMTLVATGHGAIAAGGALELRPDLFAAAFARAPVFDLVRAQSGEEGSGEAEEYGSLATKAGVDALLAASPYHHVGANTAYPAVLLSVGAREADTWQALKAAARLQAASSSGKPVLLRIEPGAGRHAAFTRAQRDAERADLYAFALWQMGEPGFQPK
jgi:prolyl oligopeptidase